MAKANLQPLFSAGVTSGGNGYQLLKDILLQLAMLGNHLFSCSLPFAEVLQHLVQGVKRGVQGALLLGRGFGGCAPLQGGKRATSGAQDIGKPLRGLQPTRVGK